MKTRTDLSPLNSGSYGSSNAPEPVNQQGMRRRDQIDSSRDVAPLKAAEDAVILHSGGKNADQVFAEVKKLLAEVASH